jgi:hypothetical protein
LKLTNSDYAGSRADRCHCQWRFLHDIGKIAIPDRILCAIMPAILLQVVMIGSNRQRNFAEMPLGIEVMQGVRQFRECEGVIDDRSVRAMMHMGLEAQKQLLVTGLEETHPDVASGFLTTTGANSREAVFPVS